MGAKIDITQYIGTSINNMEVIDAYRKISGKQKRIFFTVRCHCGKVKDDISRDLFLKGGYSSCGCKKKERARKMSLEKKKVNQEKYTGKTFITNEGYTVEIVKYNDNHNVTVKFLIDEDYQVSTTMQNIQNGELKNPFHRSVLNVGYYGVGDYSNRINGKKNPSYVTWFSMMNRCYNDEYEYWQYSYKGCQVCEEWHNYQNFAKWYEDNYYDYKEGLELDKDIVKYGNKLYSPETCIFVPKAVNVAFRVGMSELIREACIEKFKNELPQHIIEHMRNNLKQLKSM